METLSGDVIFLLFISTGGDFSTSFVRFAELGSPTNDDGPGRQKKLECATVMANRCLLRERGWIAPLSSHWQVALNV